MERKFRLILLGLVFSLLHLSMGDYTIKVQLISFSNPKGQTVEGRCCDAQQFKDCGCPLCPATFNCDLDFQICIEQFNFMFGSLDINECWTGWKDTGVVDKSSNNVVFKEGVTYGKWINPFTTGRFSGEWKKFYFKVKVNDADTFQPHKPDNVDAFTKEYPAEKYPAGQWHFEQIVHDRDKATSTIYQFKFIIECTLGFSGPTCKKDISPTTTTASTTIAPTTKVKTNPITKEYVTSAAPEYQTTQTSAAPKYQTTQEYVTSAAPKYQTTQEYVTSAAPEYQTTQEYVTSAQTSSNKVLTSETTISYTNTTEVTTEQTTKSNTPITTPMTTLPSTTSTTMTTPTTTPTTTEKPVIFQDCYEIYHAAHDKSHHPPPPKDGTYVIKIGGSEKKVRCDMKNGGWTYIQRRVDSRDFDQGYNSYKYGFGDLGKSHWLGLLYIYQMTQDKSRPYQLQITLKDCYGHTRYETYDNFYITSPQTQYKLYLKNPKGTAGDSMFRGGSSWTPSSQVGRRFGNNAYFKTGGWWFSFHSMANLNGEYHNSCDLKGLKGTHLHTGILWESWKGELYSYVETEMKIRPMGHPKPKHEYDYYYDSYPKNKRSRRHRKWGKRFHFQMI